MVAREWLSLVTGSDAVTDEGETLRPAATTQSHTHTDDERSEQGLGKLGKASSRILGFVGGPLG